jgi:hypothetical protein
MRTNRADPDVQPGWLKRTWRWLRSSGYYTGYEADHKVWPGPQQDGQEKERLATAALTQHAFWPPR